MHIIFCYSSNQQNMEGNNFLCFHHRRTVQAYCTKHDIPCCDMCVSTHHNQCVDILSEEDLWNVKHSAEADELNDEICNFRQDFTRFENSFSQIVSVLNEEKNDLLNEIQIFKSRIDTLLHQSVEKIDIEISEICQNIEEEIITDQNKIKQVGLVLEGIDDTQIDENKLSYMQYFLAMKKNITVIQEARKELELLASQNWLSDIIFQFSPNQSILEVLSKESIGKVSTTKSRDPFSIKHISSNKAQVISKQNVNKENKGNDNIRTRIRKKKKETAFGTPKEYLNQKTVSTSNRRNIVLDKDNKNLVIFAPDGKFIKCVNLPIKPNAIHYIDDSTVEVSYGTPKKYMTVKLPADPIDDQDVFNLEDACFLCMVLCCPVIFVISFFWGVS